MFEKWENKTDSRKVSNHADASTSAMRERTPMQEQRKYAENSPERKERGKSDFPETERRRKR